MCVASGYPRGRQGEAEAQVGLVTHAKEDPEGWRRWAVQGVLDQGLQVLELRVLAGLLQASAHPRTAIGDGLHLATNIGLWRVPAEVHWQHAVRLLLINGSEEPCERHRPHLVADVACHEARD